jgi:hypothetical protein
LVQDLRAAMPTMRFMGPDGIYNTGFIETAGGAAENSYATFGRVPVAQLTGKGATWYQHFKATYHEEPDAEAAFAYETASVALQAIDQVGHPDRQAILEAVRRTKDFQGLFGTWSFTATCDTTLRTMSGNQVKGGAWAVRQGPRGAVGGSHPLRLLVYPVPVPRRRLWWGAPATGASCACVAVHRFCPSPYPASAIMLAANGPKPQSTASVCSPSGPPIGFARTSAFSAFSARSQLPNSPCSSGCLA